MPNGSNSERTIHAELARRVRIAKGPSYLRHDNTTSVGEVLADGTAIGETYYLNLNERGLDHWGRFHDRFARGGAGRWLFTSREVVEEGKSEASSLNVS